jgi:hypothetical protein
MAGPDPGIVLTEMKGHRMNVKSLSDSDIAAEIALSVRKKPRGGIKDSSPV